MSFDIAVLSAKESFWDSISVWLSIAVAIGVALEAVTEFDILAGWLHLDTLERFILRHNIAKSGLLLLIIALAFEVVAAIRTHDISEQIIAGLNGEIQVTQNREQELIKGTNALRDENAALKATLTKQEGSLGSLTSRTDNFENTANVLKGRMERSLAILGKAQNDAITSASKASVASEAAAKAAANMESTLNSERAMQEGMRELVTPRVLTSEQLAALTESMKAYKGTSFDLYVTDDSDAKALFGQITSCLENAGWIWANSANMGALVFTPEGKPNIPVFSTTGFTVTIAQSKMSELGKPVGDFVSALISFGIKAEGAAVPDDKVDVRFDKTLVHIFIGKR